MVIVRKDIETKEIEIPGFRKILKNPKHPDYKELRIYIKNNWIPVDPEDDEIEIKKAKRRKQIAKENKERRPSYNEMKENMEKLIKNKKCSKELLTEFEKRKSIKNNYNNVLIWYNKEMKEISTKTDNEANDLDKIQPEGEKKVKSEEKQAK